MMSFKDTNNWNAVHDVNVNKCLKVVKDCDFKDLYLSAQIENFISHISSSHKCDEKVLFYTILAGISHYAESMKIYNIETKQVKPISVFEIIIAPSGVEKSKYINMISNSCSKIELYTYEQYYKKGQTFQPGGVYPENEKQQKNNKATFECWIKENGTVKQVYTTPSLVQMMIKTSVFFLANEGDAILQESNFYNPSDVTSDSKQGLLIDCWDGNKIIKSTVTHGSQEITDRTVSICMASTGRRWPELLKELTKVQTAGGLQERCSYFCSDVYDDANDTPLTSSAEKQFFSNLYDQLLSLNSSNVQLGYSITHVFFVIKLFGYRVFIWSREAFAFLQPRLLELKKNKPCELILPTIIMETKQHMAMRRRSAEHVARYACLIQIFSNALLILQSMDNDIIMCTNGLITEAFENEAKEKIINIFNPPLERTESFHPNGTPVQPLEVSLEAAKSAAALVFKLLFAQAIALFSYECGENNPTDEVPFDGMHKPISKKEKSILNIEKFVLQLNYKFFHKSCITDHHFRDKEKRSLVDAVLNDLATRQLLHRSTVDEPFFTTGRVKSTITYLKFLPDADDEKRFRGTLLNTYKIEYDDYKKSFQSAPLLPPGCKLTSFGFDSIRQPEYHAILSEKDAADLNQSARDINSIDSSQLARDANYTNEHSSLNFKDITSGNNKGKHQQSQHDFNDINQHLSTNDFLQLNQTETTTVVDFGNAGGLMMDDVPYLQYSSPRNNDSSNNNEELLFQNQEEEATSGDYSVNVVDNDSSSSLLSANEENIDANTPKPILEELCGLEATFKTVEGSSGSKENNGDSQKNMSCDDTLRKQLYGKVLLIPSILLTRGLISERIKLFPGDMDEILNYLTGEKLLTIEKYIQCNKRKFEAYLKYVPENIEDRTSRYLLQGRLLDVQVELNQYIESLKTIKFSTLSQRPSDLLISKLQEKAYAQLNIDVSMERTDLCQGDTTNSNDEVSNNENVNENPRKRTKSNKENVVGEDRQRKVKRNDKNE